MCVCVCVCVCACVCVCVYVCVCVCVCVCVYIYIYIYIYIYRPIHICALYLKNTVYVFFLSANNIILHYAYIVKEIVLLKCGAIYE